MQGSRWLVVAAMIVASLGMVVPAQASHMSCSAGTPVFQPGVGGVKVATDLDDEDPGWRGVCVWLLNGNGSTSAFLSAKFWIEDRDTDTLGNQLRFGICTDEDGDCQALLFSTGVELGGSVACTLGIGVCYGGGGGVYVHEQGPNPTVPTQRRTGVSFEAGGGLDQDDTFICAGVCVDETQYDAGTIHLYVDSEGPVLSIPVCVQAGNFETEDCETI